MRQYVRQRGDLVWLSFDPTKGHEQGGQRPAIILSNTKYNTVTGMAIVCPITNKAKGYVGEIPLPSDLTLKGVILSNHIRGIDYTKRRIRFSGEHVEEEVIEAVLKRLQLICSE